MFYSTYGYAAERSPIEFQPNCVEGMGDGYNYQVTSNMQCRCSANILH